MDKRKCAHCGKEINLPHVRVWEENVKVSRMLTFCTLKCMVLQYEAVLQVPEMELKSDG